jgi:putative membrane protein
MSAYRFPRRVFGQGDEPDPRFTLANERTFLAWLRTALALFAAGVALEALKLPAAAAYRLAAAGVFVALGLVASVQAWFGWMATERAMRTNLPLPGFAAGGILVAGIVAAVVLIVIGTFV